MFIVLLSEKRVWVTLVLLVYKYTNTYNAVDDVAAVDVDADLCTSFLLLIIHSEPGC